jgi:AraC-like DNA-binding protein
MDAKAGSALASVGELSAEAHRSVRTVSERVRSFSGAPPGRLLRQLRMERALRQLEEAEPTLEGLARELGYASASTFCRAFRREVGCTPAEYWRRTRNRPFSRRSRHPASLPASDHCLPALDSAARDD